MLLFQAPHVGLKKATQNKTGLSLFRCRALSITQMGPSRSHAPGLCRQNAAASNLLPNISRSSKNLAALHCQAPQETRKIWGPVTMFSEELWLENEKKCAVVRKPKPGRKRRSCWPWHLGVKVGVKAFLLAPSQTLCLSTDLLPGRRAPLTTQRQPLQL